MLFITTLTGCSRKTTNDNYIIMCLLKGQQFRKGFIRLMMMRKRKNARCFKRHLKAAENRVNDEHGNA